MKRNELLANVPDRSIWPTVNSNLIDPANKELFERRYKAINLYLDGESQTIIQSITGIHRTQLSKLLEKCLLSHSDGKIQGYRALLPYKRIESYKRNAKLQVKYPEQQGGCSGLLLETFNKYPKIKKVIDQLIEKKNSPDINVHEKSIRAVDLHQAFLKLLKKAGVSQHEWPFNTKLQGLRTIQKYSKDVLDSNFAKSVNNREGQVSSAHVPVGTGAKPLISFEEPFDAVEVDAYKINAFFSADFLTPRGTLVQVQLARIWLIAMIEVISEAIIAYSIVYRSEVSAEDVLGVIRQAVLGQNRKEITIPGLTYPTDGCFPGDAINAYKGATWGSILLDGALVHLSDAVHNRARNEIGFAINWGPAGHFERRPNIERFFSNVSKSIFMRLPSTTGSNPGNGRAKNAEDQAVKYKINADEVEQLFAVHVANYNHTPSYGNFYNSPIGTLKHFAENTSGHFIARKLPIRPEGTTLIPLKLICTVRGGRQHGRRSYVQYLGVRYTNQILSNSAGLIGKRLTLEFDSEDLRFCKAFLEDGSELGILQAGGRWHITKHNLKTRKIILSLVSKRIIVLSDFDDPVHVYLQYLTKSKKSSNNKPKGRSKKRILEPSAATEAVRVAKSADVDIQITENSTRRFAEPTLSPPKVTETFGNSILGPLPDLNKLLNGKR